MTYHAFLVATYEEKLGAYGTTYMSALELIQLVLKFSKAFFYKHYRKNQEAYLAT